MKKRKKNIKLNLTEAEKAKLRTHKLRMAELIDYAADEIEVLLAVPSERAKEIKGLAEFQQVPSIGIKFAEDLVFLGYHSLEELKGEDPAELLNTYELKKGFWIDPCVEDQFRLVVHFAKYGDLSKNWWDFTSERKKFRTENGYPANRPTLCWYDVLQAGRK